VHPGTGLHTRAEEVAAQARACATLAVGHGHQDGIGQVRRWFREDSEALAEIDKAYAAVFSPQGVSAVEASAAEDALTRYLTLRGLQDAEFARRLNWDPPWGRLRNLDNRIHADRDAYVAGRDIFLSIGRVTYEVPAQQPPGPVELAGDTAQVLLDLDLVSRERDAAEGTPTLELRQLIHSAMGACVPNGDSALLRESDLANWLREHGVDPRVLIPRIRGYREALASWRPGPGNRELDRLVLRFREALAAGLVDGDAALLPVRAREWLRQSQLERDARWFLDALDRELPTRHPAAAPGGHGFVAMGGLDRAQARRAARALPPPPPHLTGRTREIGQVTAQITRLMSAQQKAAVSLSGQPGVGKSVIAVEAARELHREGGFPGGVLYFDMRGVVVRSPDGLMVTENVPVSARQVAEDVLAILDADSSGTAAGLTDDELYASYAAALAGQQVLVVLDNILNIGQARQLLGGESSCVLITSQDTSSPVMPVIHRDWSLDIGVLDRADSIALLLKYLKACGGLPSPEDLVTCGDIAKYCDDLPLALFLAGEKLQSAYGGDAGLLASHLRAESGRLGLLRGLGPVISLSYLNLDLAARQVFRMSWTARDSASADDPIRTLAITGTELALCMDITTRQAQHSLGRLVDGSLASYGTWSLGGAQPVGQSYSLHEMARLFAQWRREEEDGAEAIAQFRRRFVEYIEAEAASSDSPFPTSDDSPGTAGALIAAALAAARLADADGSLDAGIEITRWLVQMLPDGIELARLLTAQAILVDLYNRAGHPERADQASLSFARRMRAANRRQEAISAYQKARDIASGHWPCLVGAEAAFELGLLLESGDEPDLRTAFQAMEDAAEMHQATWPFDDELQVKSLSAATSCARLAIRLHRQDDALYWAQVAGKLAQKCPSATLDNRARAMHQLGITVWTDDHAKAIEAFSIAGRWFEQDGQFGNAARAASNAASLSSGKDMQRLLRTTISYWEQAARSTTDYDAWQAMDRVRLSALLAQDNAFRDAIEALSPASRLAPNETSYQFQAREVSMRLLALRYLAGAIPGKADPQAFAGDAPLPELRREVTLLHDLARQIVEVSDAQSALIDFVCSTPYYLPPDHPGWLRCEIGKQRAIKERPLTAKDY
jgi:hypothetical protein